MPRIAGVRPNTAMLRRSGTARATRIASPFQYPRGKLNRVTAAGRNVSRSRVGNDPGNKRLTSATPATRLRAAARPSIQRPSDVRETITHSEHESAEVQREPVELVERLLRARRPEERRQYPERERPHQRTDRQRGARRRLSRQETKDDHHDDRPPDRDAQCVPAFEAVASVVPGDPEKRDGYEPRSEEVTKPRRFGPRKAHARVRYSLVPRALSPEAWCTHWLRGGIATIFVAVVAASFAGTARAQAEPPNPGASSVAQYVELIPTADGPNGTGCRKRATHSAPSERETRLGQHIEVHGRLLSRRSRRHRAMGHRPGLSQAPWTAPLAIGPDRRRSRLLTGPSRRSRRPRHPWEMIA